MRFCGVDFMLIFGGIYNSCHQTIIDAEIRVYNKRQLNSNLPGLLHHGSCEQICDSLHVGLCFK